MVLHVVGPFGHHRSYDWFGNARPKHSIRTRCRFQAGGMGPTLSCYRCRYCTDVFPRWSITSSCGNVNSLIITLFLRYFFSKYVVWVFRYTAGIVGGLSTVAVCAPSEKFLNMGGPLAIGFGAVFAASIGSESILTVLLNFLTSSLSFFSHKAHSCHLPRPLELVSTLLPFTVDW